MSKKRVCLNMIVKNEGKIIHRALDSVKHIIDYWVICDTGSTDNTAEFIENYFSISGIKGELHHVEWKNFGYNRTLALQLAHAKADYLLFMDADMELVDVGFDKNTLSHEHYTLKQFNGSLVYYNTRLVSTAVGWECVGVTHEYYKADRENIISYPLETAYFKDHADGGSKADKFARDILLLSDGLKTEPDNPRYQFYLANSYKDFGDNHNAIVWYDRRIASGGWDEEVYYAKYMKMICQIRSGYSFEQWLYTGLDAFSFRPARLEALYEILKFCRQNSHYKLGYQLGKNKECVDFPRDILFVDQPIHDWMFLDELSICAYWAGDLETSVLIIKRLLQEKKYLPQEHERLLKNLSFCESKTK